MIGMEKYACLYAHNEPAHMLIHFVANHINVVALQKQNARFLAEGNGELIVATKCLAFYSKHPAI